MKNSKSKKYTYGLLSIFNVFINMFISQMVYAQEVDENKILTLNFCTYGDKSLGLSEVNTIINKVNDCFSISKLNLGLALLFVIIILIVNNIILHKSISKRKKVEESLRESEERLRTLINASPDLIGFKDGHGRWLEINEASIEVYNLEGIDYRGKTDLEIGEIHSIYKESLQKCKESDDNAWEKGKITREEEIVPQSDGSCRIYDVIKVPLFYENGDRKGIVIIGRDVTELKKTDKRLEQSEERYRLLVEACPDGIVAHIDGKIIFANSALAELLGIKDPDGIKGKKVLDFLHEDYHEIMKEHMENRTKENNPKIVEEKLIRSDGKVIDIEVCKSFYQFEDKLASLSIVRDISERKIAEKLQKRIEEEEKRLKEAEEYERLRNEFFGNLSHEFKTPLNLIFSTVQLLDFKFKNIISGEDEKKFNQYIKILNQNGYRLLRLINNLIDMTKIDSNYFNIDLRNCNIVSVVEDIIMSVAQYIENKDIEIIFDTDVEEKIMACDPDKIERIILNLVSNSLKFTEVDGRITVNIYDRGKWITISIKDTGIGIPEDKLDLIFNRFGQVDKSTTRNHEGSGIGLSLVKSLVEMHEGTIEVKSQCGKGTEFTINLPVKLLSEESFTNSNNNMNQNCVERINIEFSDIYE